MSGPVLIEAEFSNLLDQITRETGFRCSCYKGKCLMRRIAVRMRARGAESFASYASVLDGDLREYDRLVDALTVNVTRFFRNRSTFTLIAHSIIPELWARRSSVSVWSAGAASGEEAYSLAALFHEHAASCGNLESLGRVSVVGSDIDRASISAAERAEYGPAAFSETPPDLIDRLFPGAGVMRTVSPAVRGIVTFERRDLLRQHPGPEVHDLIACRNVIIYLGRDAQEELLCALHRSLRSGGYLVLGRAETLFGRPRDLFTLVDAREHIFRKVA